MGEYAFYRGEEIKIGTCEDLFYMRADQQPLISGYEFDGGERFRFPWPDEDHLPPGDFESYDRACALHGLKAPAQMAGGHYRVQFVAHAGYNVCLPCPEAAPDAPEGGPIKVNGLFIHRNGFEGLVLLCQQKRVNGRLEAVVRCGGCGMRCRLSMEEASAAAEWLRAEGERQNSGWYLQVAARLVAGYLPAREPAAR